MQSLSSKIQKLQSGFVITVGENGATFAFHNKKEILHKIFFTDLNSDVKKNLSDILNKNKSIPIYILLDTIDQSYKKKDYPFIKKYDLLSLIKRDLNSDSQKNHIKNYLILKNSQNSSKVNKEKKWNCIFINASISKITQDVIDFINEVPNYFSGIYLSAIESTNLFLALKENIKASSKMPNKKNEIYFLVSQNKVSGIRQTVFFEDQIIFTRLLDYKSDDKNFAERYEKDIYSTSQYLKRIFPEIDVLDIETINILPDDLLKKISAIKNIDFNFINYTPHKACAIACLNNVLSENNQNCDLIFSKIFIDSKKKNLRFSTKKIDFINKLFIFSKTSYFLNLFILLIIGSYIALSVSNFSKIQEEILNADQEKNLAIIKSNKATYKILSKEEMIDIKNNKNIDIGEIIDLGKNYELFKIYEDVIFANYLKLKFTKTHPISFEKISFLIENFNNNNLNQNFRYKIYLKAKIINKSGDIENLFSQFDYVVSDFKKEFQNQKITNSDLPKEMNFANKYYDLPIEISINARE